MALVASMVLGILNVIWSVITASSPVPDPNLKVTMSGFFFLTVILKTLFNEYLCLTSESSLNTISEL